jgi:hypothetical protein
MEKETKIKVEDYGDMFAKLNDMELVSYETDGGYQGEYKIILLDKKTDRLFYYFDYYGSCSGCDWLEAEKDWDTGEIDYKKALDYVQQIKPKYITPSSIKLDFEGKEYDGFKIKNPPHSALIVN